MEGITPNTLNCSSQCQPSGFSISGASVLCNSSNYVFQYLPANTTVSWSVSPSGLANVTVNPDKSATLTMLQSGVITLTASITICSNQTVTLNKQIRVGGYTNTNSLIWSSSPPFCRNQTVYFWVNPDFMPAEAVTYNWYFSGANYVSGQGTRMLTLKTGTTFYGSNPAVSVGLSIGNACGSSSAFPFKTYSINTNCYTSSSYQISPNPT
jgi:PKD-like domain